MPEMSSPRTQKAPSDETLETPFSQDAEPLPAYSWITQTLCYFKHFEWKGFQNVHIIP